MNLTGMDILYGNATTGCEITTPRLCVLSTCDIAATGPGAGQRMLNYLDASIRQSDFDKIARLGFNFVRLPLGYWQLIDMATAPNAPDHTANRWLALQKMLPAKAYRPYIERVLRYAKAAGLTVLLDLHGAPGGQSTNQCTGCATSCEGDGCNSGLYYFFTEYNRKNAVAAVVELAKICQAFASSCYGVELLNEPAPTTPLGASASSSPLGASASSSPLGASAPSSGQRTLSLAATRRMVEEEALSDGRRNDYGDRDFLLEYYAEAIHALRTEGGLDQSKPIVIMDWPTWLGTYWADHALGLNQSIPLPGAGALEFETHIYSPVHASELWQLEAFASTMFDFVNAFTRATRIGTFVGEYALDNIFAPLQLEDVARWYYAQTDGRHEWMRGLAIWNYDGPGTWGAVTPNGVTNATIRDWWADLNRQ